MRVIDVDFDNILLDEKSYETFENIFICDISYKAFMGAKPLRIRSNEIGGSIKNYDVIKYLALFGSKRCDAVYNKIRYLVSKESGIAYIISHSFERIRIDSYNFLPVEKTLTFHNVIILIKSVLNKKKINHYYNIVLEKVSHEDKSNTYLF